MSGLNLLGRDYERVAMCAHPDGTHEHVPLKPGEEPPTTCFADCDCQPVVYVRADLYWGAVDPAEIVAWLRGRTGYGGGFTSADDVADAIERRFITERGHSS